MAVNVKPSLYDGLALGPNAQGVFVIGSTQDATYGGDMSNDTAGLGVTLDSDSGNQQFALAVYADDNNTTLPAGWVSSIFGSMKIYADVSSSVNLSAFGATGQLHVDGSITGIGNLAGVYGVAETSGNGITLTNNFSGGLFGPTLASGDTLASGYYMSGIQIGGNIAGTTTGHTVGIYFQNPSGSQWDYAFAFGQNSQFAGCVTAAAVGGSQTHKVKVIAGGTAYFIPLHTA